jgi:hypothetical protein
MPEHQQQGSHRFFRDGAPYIEEFELVISHLLNENSGDSKVKLQPALILIREIYEQLAESQKALGKTEIIIEESRKNNDSLQKINKLAEVCLDIQDLQLKLVSSTTQFINEISQDLK